jgi:phosphoserine phosphatase
VPDARFLVVFDADSTLLRNEVIELIADEAGRGAEVAAATEAAMRGEVDFATSLRSRVAALRGVPLSAFDRVRARVEPTPGRPSSSPRSTPRRAGRRRLRRIPRDPRRRRSRARRRRWRANRLAVDGGVLSGLVDGEIVDAAGKAAALREWAAASGVRSPARSPWATARTTCR